MRQVQVCFGTWPGIPFLTSTAGPAKNPAVILRPGNFYQAWRERNGGLGSAGVLRDGSVLPPERLVQSIWQHQRIRRDVLKTGAGKRVRIFHPGFASAEGGPDFRGAVLQIGDEPPVSGDVEIDLQASGWHAHGHDRNPRFGKVVLHVVWGDVPNSKSQVPGLPTLALQNCLDAPLAELALALENESGLPENLRGQCSAPLRELSESQLTELLHAAAKIRFQERAAAMLARARHGGWEQTLWEYLFRALGYKHNAWPMQNLAETRSIWQPGADSALMAQARLLGIGGLLPDELTRSQKSSDTYLRRAWDIWWRDRDGLAGCRVPRAAWKFHGLRPANHPQRRLALASHWLASGNLVSKIERWSAAEVPERVLAASLQQVFQVAPDDFWAWHWTFNSARLPRPQPLLGEARATDLAVNVVLPWLWIRAHEGGNRKILAEMERRYLAWPAGEDNSVLKLARQRLLGTTSPRVLKKAATQQGLMQIIRDFCEHSNAVCADCQFPGLVRRWGAPLAI
jgi:hypothetical protein